MSVYMYLDMQGTRCMLGNMFTVYGVNYLYICNSCVPPRVKTQTIKDIFLPDRSGRIGKK